MFKWTHAHPDEGGPETCYQLDGVEVARLSRRADAPDGWVAHLNLHLHMGPKYTKPCSSFENGRRDVELWAERHRERLTYEVGRINALRPRRGGGRFAP